MKSQFLYPLVFISFLLYQCGGTGSKNEKNAANADEPTQGTVGYVDLSDPLEEDLVSEGMVIFEDQCAECHGLDAELKTGPGWSGITNRRSPEWIMTMILNVNTMVQVDSIAHSLLEETGVQMPDQRLAIDEARSVLEFMRRNDLDQLGMKDQGVGVSMD